MTSWGPFAEVPSSVDDNFQLGALTMAVGGRKKRSGNKISNCSTRICINAHSKMCHVGSPTRPSVGELGVTHLPVCLFSSLKLMAFKYLLFSFFPLVLVIPFFSGRTAGWQCCGRENLIKSRKAVEAFGRPVNL